MIPEPVKFLKGIASMASQIQALGLKIGIYSSARTETCAGYLASIRYELLRSRPDLQAVIDAKNHVYLNS
jgi:alpha-galactosidase